MKRFYFVLYGVLSGLLLLVTPFDLALTDALVGNADGVFHIVSEMGYLPPFFIGYFGVGYYVWRFSNPKVPAWFRYLVYAGALIGVVSLSYMFVFSMRFLPYYLMLSPFMILSLLVGAYYASRHVFHKRLFEFDYLAALGMGLIVYLYFSVTQLKRFFGRARYYLVSVDETLFTDWYEIQERAIHRDFYSMPSGHMTFVAVALWVVLVVMVIPRTRIPAWKVAVPVFFWIAVQGYARIRMGEHFVTDIVFSVLYTAMSLHALYYACRHLRGYLTHRFKI
ncbi:MAG: phosphatase PAP2 family protein [Candidatus Izemoplasmataceae bacterium]